MKSIINLTLFLTLCSIYAQNPKVSFELVSFSKVNTNDFAPSLFGDDKLFFVSDRPDNILAKLFYVKGSDFSKVKSIEIKNCNSSLRQATLDDEKNVLYFNKKDDNIELTHDVRKLNDMIYKGVLKEGKVFKYKKLLFCDVKKSYSGPSILNNKLLVVEKDENTSKLVVFFNRKGRWGMPVTIFEEAADMLNPYYKDDNTIIFASKREGGLGGYDLYQITNEDGVWSEPVNLKLFNTKLDDYNIVYTSEKEGYISSNRKGVANVFKFTTE